MPEEENTFSPPRQDGYSENSTHRAWSLSLGFTPSQTPLRPAAVHDSIGVWISHCINKYTFKLSRGNKSPKGDADLTMGFSKSNFSNVLLWRK